MKEVFLGGSSMDARIYQEKNALRLQVMLLEMSDPGMTDGQYPVLLMLLMRATIQRKAKLDHSCCFPWGTTTDLRSCWKSSR